jgi:hypothetical protein
MRIAAFDPPQDKHVITIEERLAKLERHIKDLSASLQVFRDHPTRIANLEKQITELDRTTK